MNDHEYHKVVWLDLETTGVNADKDQILEIAVAVADFSDPFNHRHVYQDIVHFPFKDRETLDPHIIDMHIKNGLLQECFKTWRECRVIEDDLLKLSPFNDKEKSLVLAGSSVHFDASFLRVHMPEFFKRFSYRYIDVSSLKLVCEGMGMSRLNKAEAHRAKDDIDESVAHGKHCVEWLSHR